jgi:methane/ammonia monooxygenase subunit C
MAIAATRRLEIPPATSEATKVWSPAPLLGMGVFVLGLLAAWRWYEQIEGFNSGLDASEPIFTEKWMPLWYLNCTVAAIAQITIPLYFWRTRDRHLDRLAPALELRRYFTFFAILVAFGLGSLGAIVFGASDAAWHQVVVRDTSLTPSHIVLFFGTVPLFVSFAMAAFFYSLTRLPRFADNISMALLVSVTGVFLTLPSVAYNEWGHAYWLMEELFIAPLHWGFVILGWSSLAVLAVIVQSVPRCIELVRLITTPFPAR